MRIIFLLSLSFLLAINHSFSQKISLSKNTFPYNIDEEIRIIGLFNDTLHAIVSGESGELDLHVFTPDLVAIENKKIFTGTKDEKIVSWVSFSDAYYLLISGNNTDNWKIYRVGASGFVEDKTSEIRTLISGNETINSKPIIIEKISDRLCIVHTVYHEKEKKLLWSLYSMDSVLKNRNNYAIELDFDHTQQLLNNVQFVGLNSTYITRSYNKHSQKFGELEIIRCDFTTGKVNVVNFSSMSDRFQNSKIWYNSIDSSLMLWSETLREGKSTDGINRKFYQALLNNNLEEIAPPKFISLKTKENETTLVLVGNSHPHSLSNVTNALTTRSYYSQTTDQFMGPQYFNTQFFGRPQSYNMPEVERIQSYSSREVSLNQPRQTKHTEDVALNMRTIWLSDSGSVINNRLLKAQNRRVRTEYNSHFVAYSKPSVVYLIYPLRLKNNKSTIGYTRLSNTSMHEQEILNLDIRLDYRLYAAKQIDDRSVIIPYTNNKYWALLKLSINQP